MQAVVVERALLGSDPAETMPDGLISVCGCERECGCVFAIIVFTELLTVCIYVCYFTSIFEF